VLKLLAVDDEEFIQETLCVFFRNRGYDTYGASSGEEALHIIKKERPHLVLLDVMLAPGGMNGFEVLQQIREIDKTIKVIIIKKLENEALPKIGAQLFEDFRREADDNRRLYEELNQGMIQTITALAKALDARDRYTYGHSERVAEYAVGIAEIMGFSEEEKELVRIGGLLHDIGKLGISDEVLRKPGRLTEDEFNEIKKHPREGAKILESIPRLRKINDIVLHHHERYDGKGYPDGVKSKDISENAQIVAVADRFDNMASWILAVSDAYDAMTSPRPYRDARTHEAAMEELIRCKGTQFDPRVVEAFQEYYQRNKEKFKPFELAIDYKDYPILFIGEDKETLGKIESSLNSHFTIELAGTIQEALDILGKGAKIRLAVIFQQVSSIVDQELMNEMIANRVPVTKIALNSTEDIRHYDKVINKCQVFKYAVTPSNPLALQVEIMKNIEEAISKGEEN